jgi:hypothetical protein
VGPASSRSCPAHEIRKAERRQTRNPFGRICGCGRAPDLLCALRVRRAGEGALACRRSTAALAAANQRRRSAPARASWDAVGAHDLDGSKDRALLRGRYPLLPVPVQRAPRRPVMVPAGRFAGAARERQ